MGISLRKQFIYFVIPKTGSATLRKALGPYVDIRRPTEHFSEHVTIRRFLEARHADLTARFLKFTFVRNPYDRLYSGFQQDFLAAYKLDHWAEAKRPIFDRIGENFPRYLTEYVTEADLRSDPFWICFCPMTEFTHLDGKRFVDFVGRSENLREDLKRLEALLDIECQPTEDLNVRDPSRDPLKYRRHYTRAAVEVVNDIYADDFRLHGYQMLDPKEFPS